MTLYGYARISTEHQSLSSQMKALRDYGCKSIISEKKSGKNKDDRKEFLNLIEDLNSGDILVVTKLDRFARSTKDALEVIEVLEKKEIGLVVLNMGGSTLDTTTSIGKLMLIMLTGIAEFELSLMKERQREGIAEAKKRGVYNGRPIKYSNKNPKLIHAMELYNRRNSTKMTVKDIVNITGISRTTLYKKIKEMEKE